MEAVFESLKQISLKVELESPSLVEIPEKFLEILPVYSKEKILEMADKKKTDLFGMGLLGIRKPRPEEVKMKDVKEFFKPYWYLKGYYECEWLNKTSYPIPVPEDVVAVKFEDKIIKVKKEALKISDMLEKIGINLGWGPISLSFPTRPIVSTVLKNLGKDEIIGSKSHIVLENIIELRLTQVEAELCIDALTGKEDKETLELITKNTAQETEKRELPKISKDYAFDKWKEKFNEIDKRIGNEAEKITKRKISVKEIGCYLIPWFKVTFEMGETQKSLEICAVDGKVNKEK